MVCTLLLTTMRCRNGEFDALTLSEQIELEGENCSVQCDSCAGWYHSFCVGINCRAALPSEDEDWLCPSCNSAGLAIDTAVPAASTAPVSETEAVAPTSAAIHRSDDPEVEEACVVSTRGGQLPAAQPASSREPRLHARGAAAGTKITVKQSAFQAHLCGCTGRRQIAPFMRSVVAACSGATTHSVAYRWSNIGRDSNSDDPVEEGCEDGGEDGAGSEILALLRRADIRNVCLVVSRW